MVGSSGRRWVTRGMSGAVVLAASLTLAACGDNKNDNTSGGATAAPDKAGGQSANKDVAAAEKFLSEHTSGKGGELPTATVKPAQGKNIWMISCGEAASGCAAETKGVRAAVGALKSEGWKFTLFDTKLDPSRFGQGVSQAVVAGADGIVLGSVDCATVKPQLQQARKKGIAVVGLMAYDCDDPTQGGGQALFTSNVALGPDETPAESARTWGQIQAAWSVKKTGGNVKSVEFVSNQTAVTKYIAEGFSEYMKSCGGCKTLASEPFLLKDIGPPLQQKAASALLKNPDVNVIAAPHDPSATFVANAVNAAGKSKSVSVLGSLGLPSSIEMIRAGRGQAMDVGIDAPWAGWAATDDLVRHFNDEDPVYSGYGVGLIDADHLPDGKEYHAAVDYEANYRTLWGVG